MAQGDTLRQLSQYAPLASGVPFKPHFGFEGTPLGDNPMLGMVLGPIVSPLLEKMGMAPMGIGGNVYDTLQSQRLFRQQQELQRMAAENDRESWKRTLRGVASMTGTPWGSDQIQAANGMTSAMAWASPMLNMVNPELLDEMAGFKGSQAVMASHMMNAGRYRLDPATGMLGQDAKTVFAQTQKIFKDLYSDNNFKNMQGITAGQLGGLYEQLGSRGMLPGSATQDAFGATGAAGSSLAKLMSTPGETEQARTFDTERVKKSLQSYLGVVNAVKDIFGDMGQPDAPMGQLIGALEALTNHSVGQVGPDRLKSMVRMTQQLSNMTGIGLNNALAIQQDASARAQQLGIEPIFGVSAMQGSLAFGGAYNAMGGSSTPAWGRFNSDQMIQMDAHLRTNASASRAAQRMGLAVRISDEFGGLDPNSRAGMYVAALRTANATGADTWYDGTSQKARSLNMSEEEFFDVFTGVKGLTRSQLENRMEQKAVNRETLDQIGAGDIVRRSQNKMDMTPFLSRHLLGFLPGQTGKNANLAREALETSDSNNKTRAQRIIEQIDRIDQDTFGDTAARTSAMGKIFQDELGNTAFGKQATGDMRSAGEAADYYKGLAGSFYGHADRMIRTSGDTAFLGGYQNKHALFNEKTLKQAVRIQMQAAIENKMRDVLSPLNRGSMLRRAVGYLQQLGTKDADEGSLVELAAASIGVNAADVRKELVTPYKDFEKAEADMKAASLALQAIDPENETDPVKRRALIAQKNALSVDFENKILLTKSTMARVTDAGVKLGVREDAMTSLDFKRVTEFSARRNKYSEAFKASGLSFADFMKTADGQLYVESVDNEGKAAADVAAKVLESEAGGSRFGLRGINAAEQIRNAQRELFLVAGQYTGGSLHALSVGEFDPKMSPEDRAKAIGRRDAALGLQNKSVKELSDMASLGQRAWTSEEAMAWAHVDKKTADLARGIDAEGMQIIHRMESVDRNTPEGREEYDDLSNSLDERSGGATAGQVVKAEQAVFGPLRAAREAFIKRETANSEESARSLVKLFGLKPDDSDNAKKQLNDLGELMRSSPGQALTLALEHGDKETRKAAGLGDFGEVDSVEKLNKVYSHFVLTGKLGGADSVANNKVNVSFEGGTMTLLDPNHVLVKPTTQNTQNAPTVNSAPSSVGGH